MTTNTTRTIKSLIRNRYYTLVEYYLNEGLELELALKQVKLDLFGLYDIDLVEQVLDTVPTITKA